MEINQKNYFLITSVIFAIIAVLHLARILLDWYAEIGGWVVPVWLSWVALVVAGYLAYEGFRLNKK